MKDKAFDALKEACQNFVDKVDAGRARSTESYREMKAALALAGSVGGEQRKSKDWIEEQIEGIMYYDGPDQHTDGSDVITDFIESLLDGTEDEWIKEYDIRVDNRRKQYKIA